MDLKKLDKSAQLAIIGMVIIIFAFLFFVDAKYIRWMYVLLVVAFVPIYLKYKPKRKTKIEKFYEAVIKNTAANEKGILGDPTNNLRLKSLKMLEKDEDDERTEYTFKMGTGNSRSQYEKYKEGLEQYLDSPVEFSFDHNLIITVFKKPLDKYK